jgi:cyclopropane fatty-acyl-phospholipid synthase-like methyltransferase
MKSRREFLAAGAAWIAGCAAFEGAEPTIITGGEAPTLIPEVPYVPTPDAVVAAMLELARVGPGDLVYDLGCGDGRIVIAAAAKYGARGYGVDIDPAPLIRARRDARRAGVAERVRFERGDLFETDLRPATVVTLYLFEQLNARLMPKLRAELRPGARVVSHKFGMGAGWLPEKTVSVGDSRIYLWTVAARLAGE